MKRKTKFPRRGRKRRPRVPKRNLTYLHDHERAVILADIAALRLSDTKLVSVDTLDRQTPGRYDRIYLGRALRRMRDAGDLKRWGVERSFRTRSRIVVYELSPSLATAMDASLAAVKRTASAA